jgi:UDP-N-acetylglucosamine 3-dehydrogenase
VFVEKPIASDLRDADAMIETCERAAVPLMVGHILRHDSAYVAMRQAVEEGRLGRLLTAYARRNAIIQEGHRLGGRTSVVQYLAVHDIDLLLWYHDVPFEGVTARAVRGRIAETYGTPDFVWLWIRFADGALGIVECVTTGTRPLCDGQAGRSALVVCLAAEASLANDGAEVPLSAIERTTEFERSEGGQHF